MKQKINRVSNAVSEIQQWEAEKKILRKQWLAIFKIYKHCKFICKKSKNSKCKTHGFFLKQSALQSN